MKGYCRVNDFGPSCISNNSTSKFHRFSFHFSMNDCLASYDRIHLFLLLCFCVHSTFLFSLSLLFIFVSSFKAARLYFCFFCFQFHSVVFCWLRVVQTALCLLIMRLGLCRNFDRAMLSLICVVSTPQVLQQYKILS